MANATTIAATLLHLFTAEITISEEMRGLSDGTMVHEQSIYLYNMHHISPLPSYVEVSPPERVSGFESGDVVLISSALFEDGVVTIPPTSTVTLSPVHISRRRRSVNPGVRRVLSVYLRNNDGAIPANTTGPEDLDAILWNNTLTFGVQYEACTNNTIHFVNASEVIDLNATIDVTNSSLNEVVSHVRPLLEADPRVDPEAEFDHIMIFQPSLSTYLGTAFLNDHWSRYGGGCVTGFDCQVHEIGHNLGLHHSNHPSSSSINEYYDMTCAMGFGISQISLRRVCFNHAKNVELGLLGNIVTILHSECAGTSTTYNLIGASNYDTNDPTDIVALVLGDDFSVNAQDASNPNATTTGKYYLGFNDPVGPNADSFIIVDNIFLTRIPSVTIQSRPNGLFSMSGLETYLGEGGTYVVDDKITITVDDIVSESHATVRVVCASTTPASTPSSTSSSTLDSTPSSTLDSTPSSTPSSTSSPTTSSSTPSSTSSSTTPSPTSSSSTPESIWIGAGVSGGVLVVVVGVVVYFNFFASPSPSYKPLDSDF